MPELTPDTVVARGTSHVETEVADQIMMMSIEQGKYYALEGTAKAIWQRLTEPTTIGDLVAGLVEDYDVDPAQCQADVTAFLQDMIENGLVEDHGTSADA